MNILESLRVRLHRGGEVISWLLVSSAREVLTGLHTSDGRPLFANAQDLGRQIARIPPHPNEAVMATLLEDPSRISNRYHDRPKQAGNFLNMVLAGVKPCPKGLRDLIAVAIRERLGPERRIEAETWIAKVNTAFAEQQAVEREAKFDGSHALLATQYLEEAGEVLFVRPVPHDEFEFRSDHVLESCLHRLGLDSKNLDSGGEVTLRVTICLPSEAHARSESELLLRMIRARFVERDQDVAQAFEERLRQVVEEDCLRVIALQRAPAMIPFIALDLSDQDRMSAFCYTVSRTGKPAFLHLPRASCFDIQISFLNELKPKPHNVLRSLL